MLRGKAATIVAERVAVTDEAGNAIDVKAQIEELNSDVDAMLAAQAAEQAGDEGDIEVSDLSIDVAGTIESDGPRPTRGRRGGRGRTTPRPNA